MIARFISHALDHIACLIYGHDDYASGVWKTRCPRCGHRRNA